MVGGKSCLAHPSLDNRDNYDLKKLAFNSGFTI